MNVFQALVKALRTATNIPELTLTCTGREGFGNQVARLHYNQQHLVAKVTLRNDFREGERELYLNHFAEEKVHPWTLLHEQPAPELHNLDKLLGIETVNHLTSSVVSANLLLTAMANLRWDKLYLRQWKADNGGIGLELIGVTDEGIFEVSINYYSKPVLESLQETLEREQQLKSQPVAEAV